MFSQACVSHSVHSRPHDYSITAHPFYGTVSTEMLSCCNMKLSSWICFIFVRSDAFKFQPFQKAVSTREEHFAELVQKQKRNVHCKIPHHSFGIFCNYEFNICWEKLYVKERDI